MLNIKREREMLSTAGKRTWDDVSRIIDSMNISSEKKEMLKQHKMAAIRYADLQSAIDYNSRSNDVMAQKAVSRYRLEQQRMNKEYNESYPLIKNELPNLNQKIVQRAEEIKKQNTKKN